MDRSEIFDKNNESKGTDYIAETDVENLSFEDVFSKDDLRESLPLPNVSELQVVRHYNILSSLNFSVDSNFYPLGSCTMKYNPKVNEYAASLAGFNNIHPFQFQEHVQGALKLIYDLEQALCALTGMDRFTFQPSSGAQGELAGMLMIKKFHEAKGNRKTKVIIPDSAHGTNPATASMCGYQVITIKSGGDGLVDVEKLKEIVDDDVAAIMLTNPNTLGLFEENILEISEIVHSKGGLLYYDGANFNPLLGITNPSLMGFDVIHLNLHKTFSTPHGCGGPGSGAVGVKKRLEDFLPFPLIDRNGDKFCLNYKIKNSIGRLRSFYGNFSVLVRAYTYILRLGKNGLLRVAQIATLGANYIKEKLKDEYKVAYPKRCMHEVVFSCQKQKERGAKAIDISKRLIDFDIHPPTMYFPLIVAEALMVEPTETESKQVLDYFIKVMKDIDKEIDQNLELIKTAPHFSPVKRVDEVKAARFPDLKWEKSGD